MRTCEDLSDEEYKVYSIALCTKDLPKPELMVFKKRTESLLVATASSPDDPPFSGNPEKIIAFEFPEIANETVKDFIEKNRTNYPLEPKFHLAANQEVLFKEEEQSLWEMEVGNQSRGMLSVLDQRSSLLKGFDDRYPKAKGMIFSLSRVGFNNPGNQALVEIVSRRFGSGDRLLVFLSKGVDGTWVPSTKSLHWIA
jgi:hypothetical protein